MTVFWRVFALAMFADFAGAPVAVYGQALSWAVTWVLFVLLLHLWREWVWSV